MEASISIVAPTPLCPHRLLRSMHQKIQEIISNEYQQPSLKQSLRELRQKICLITKRHSTMGHATEATFYAELEDYPRPNYPFPDLINPYAEKLAAEGDDWIDEHCPFASSKARASFKKHRLTDVGARAFPYFTPEELRPIARFSTCFAMIDDYLDHADKIKLGKVRDRVTQLLLGQGQKEREPGFYHQACVVREEILGCGVPVHVYEDFVNAVIGLMNGYGDEKRYNAADKPPPFDEYQSIRRQSSGGLPYAKSLAFHGKYCDIPAKVLKHPTILRMHDIVSDLIGYHNDFISLPKELYRKGDVINLVLVVQAASKLPLKEAYLKALEIHDLELAEFVELQNALPCFGRWQSVVESYVVDLGIIVQGSYSWHIKNTERYLPGAYVEPEAQALKGQL